MTSSPSPKLPPKPKRGHQNPQPCSAKEAKKANADGLARQNPLSVPCPALVPQNLEGLTFAWLLTETGLQIAFYASASIYGLVFTIQAAFAVRPPLPLGHG